MKIRVTNSNNFKLEIKTDNDLTIMDWKKIQELTESLGTKKRY